MYKILKSGILLFLLIQCSSYTSDTHRLIVNEYPSLYQAIFERNGTQILEFTSHSDSLIRVHAWRALIQTSVEDLDHLIQKVVNANTLEAWASLWFKDFDENHIEYFHSLWASEPKLREGLLHLFSKIGNRTTFELLIAQEEIGNLTFDYKLAHATGARSKDIKLTVKEEKQLIDKALATKLGYKTQAYLYGYYRARKQFTTEVEYYALNKWAYYYPTTSEGNQSLVRILGVHHLDKVLQHFPIEYYENMNVQLAIEIAQSIGENPPSRYSKVILNALLNHKNPNVQIATLQAIQRHPDVAKILFVDIMNKIALIDYRESLVRMEAFNTIHNPKRYEDEIISLAGSDPSLQTLKYRIYDKIYTVSQLYDLLHSDIKSKYRLQKLHAIQFLADWWPNANSKFRLESVDEMRELVPQIARMNDRSMTIAIKPLLMDSIIVSMDDYPQLEKMLATFSLPEDIEVFQSLSEVMYSRFREKAQPYIDSLALKGNKALNISLINQGWEINEIDNLIGKFRQPDWNKVAILTLNPYLVLETKKGKIILKLDIKKAPVTIAGIDSLMTAGAYQNKPFHRVISNFVIQGGDIETQDGYGGPNYVVPTEASSTMYDRGIVGIASAGVDTEGSQFFIMHQWKPHLDGRYTVIGEVVEGMDVVDNILQGDVIERMYWY